MTTLTVNLQYCYGISHLQHTFDFSNSRVILIYAPNGVMKTSFAKAFKDIANRQDSQDLHFSERETVRIVKLDGRDVESWEVFVVDSYDESFSSNNLSTLLVNPKLREEYQNQYKVIMDLKKKIFKELRSIGGFSNRDNIDSLIKTDLLASLEDLVIKDSFLDNLQEVPSLFLQIKGVKYKDIFNDKVLKILKNAKVQSAIRSYIDSYNKLIEESPIFTRYFVLDNAVNVQKTLKREKFFQAGHQVILKDEGVIENEDTMEAIIHKYKQTILEDKELKNKFEEVDKFFSNVETKRFRQLLLKNPELIPFLSDLTKLKKYIWYKYFSEVRHLLVLLKNTVLEAKNNIARIIQKAQLSKTEWDRVISEFNDRFFHLPFVLRIDNKVEAILQDKAPSLKFIYREDNKEGTNKKIYSNRDELIKKLSTGEKRAFYLLDIIFEITALKKQNQETILIFDDIADSFDYKNKYAIVEYLKDLSEYDKFFLIILTHNYDFFRTIKKRISVPYGNTFIALKTHDEVKLTNIQNLHLLNPFKGWIREPLTDARFIALIPFARNLVEYMYGHENEDYKTLTQCLHYNDELATLSLKKVIETLQKCIPAIPPDKIPQLTKEELYFPFLLNIAEEIYKNDPSETKLENKIVLSLVTRLMSERMMLAKLIEEDPEQYTKYAGRRTSEIFREYKNIFDNTPNIRLFRKVLLITPEHIHLNSFMYEPLIDLSIVELKKLYEDVSEEYNKIFSGKNEI